MGRAGGDEDRVAGADRHGLQRAEQRVVVLLVDPARAACPAHVLAPADGDLRARAAARTIHASVLPKARPRCSRANARVGVVVDGQALAGVEQLDQQRGARAEARGMLGAEPSLGIGGQRVADEAPSGMRLSPRSVSPKSVDAEPIHSSGEWSPPTSIPRSSAIAGPPR